MSDTDHKDPYEPLVPESLEEINFLDQRIQNCPYHAYQKLRDDAPVWQDPLTGFYVVTRFEDLRGALLDPTRYANSMKADDNHRNRLDVERGQRMMALYQEKGWIPGPHPGRSRRPESQANARHVQRGIPP